MFLNLILQIGNMTLFLIYIKNWHIALLSLTQGNKTLIFYWNDFIPKIQILHKIFCAHLHIDLSLLEFSSVIDLNLSHWITIFFILFFCDAYSLLTGINLFYL